MKNNLSKVITISVLILVVVIALFIRNRKTQEIRISESAREETSNALSSANLAEGKVSDHQTSSESREKDETESRVLTISKKPQRLHRDALAVVNDFTITKDYLEKRYESLPSQYKREFKNDKDGFLDQLILRELLYQEAEKRGLVKDTSIVDVEQRQESAIQELIKDINKKIEVSEDEMIGFYNDRKSEMRGASFEQVKSSIQDYLIQQKQEETMDQLIQNLRNDATLILNEEWVETQRASKPQNPLTEALKSGKPTVLDLGAGTCIPCKMMKPIFEELEKEYKGRANIILLEISDHRDLARKYGVRVMPTQIFIDTEGNVYWRHEGFLSKDAIIKKLKEMGVE